MSRFFKGDVSSSSGSESESSSDEDVVPSSAAGRTGTTTSAPPPKKTTGGFFRQLAESSSDDSEDDSDSDQSSDADSSDSDATHAGQDAPAKQPNRFIKGAASDSSDSDTDNEGFGKKRKVESGQAKRAKELKGLADEVAEAVSRGNAASVQAGKPNFDIPVIVFRKIDPHSQGLINLSSLLARIQRCLPKDFPKMALPSSPMCRAT